MEAPIPEQSLVGSSAEAAKQKRSELTQTMDQITQGWKERKARTGEDFCVAIGSGDKQVTILRTPIHKEGVGASQVANYKDVPASVDVFVMATSNGFKGLEFVDTVDGKTWEERLPSSGLGDVKDSFEGALGDVEDNLKEMVALNNDYTDRYSGFEVDREGVDHFRLATSRVGRFGQSSFITMGKDYFGAVRIIDVNGADAVEAYKMSLEKSKLQTPPDPQKVDTQLSDAKFVLNAVSQS